MKKKDCSLQEWTEYQRALERHYDAKRRAARRDGEFQLTREQRAKKREKQPKIKPSEKYFEILVAAVQGLVASSGDKEKPASGALGELKDALGKTLKIRGD